MHNTYIKARPKKKVVKESAFEKHEKRVSIALSLIKARGSISDFDIRHVLKLSNNLQYQLMSDLQHNYQEYVSWNKKTRLFTHLKTFEIIEENEIKEKITENDYKIMHAIKQEANNG